MPSGTALAVLADLAGHGVDAFVGGGWAVDALLGEQTRSHGDLDLWLPAEYLERLFRALARHGIDRVLPWPGDRPWNFVLHDGERLRVDLHLYEPLPDGRLHYGSVIDPVVFPGEALTGRGTIAGTPVRCESAQWSLRWHTGYPARPVDHHDVPLLCQRFGLALPPGFAFA